MGGMDIVLSGGCGNYREERNSKNTCLAGFASKLLLEDTSSSLIRAFG
jgi:hypothetical protein